MRRTLLALAGAASLLAAPVSAQPLDALQQADAAVQSVGWKLARANARFCTRTAPGIGLLLQDARTFDDPAAARTLYGLKGDIAVGAVARDGTAAKAGLDANDTVIAVAGRPVSAVAVPAQGSWDRVFALQGLLENTVATTGSVTLTLAGGREVTVAGESACHVRFLLDDGEGNASANRDDVRIGRRLYDATHGDETLLAALIAHELAHAALDHPAAIDAARNRLATVRETEREADRLAVWLLANAGYAPESEVRLMETVIARQQSFLAPPTHGGWRTRAADVRTEIAALTAAPDTDWPLRFRRNVR
ncbi:hypothetical protein OLX02_04720 [Novosphingobium sp. KCTC 2891]|uniref:hypothetical protein n=1 Tax=Novosphingobium sp. KCTC 2891 TaxID=2989730 RepID=UPI002222EF61|nr:hypothetical protein [Novosphingobium sp. KCTC 2891]MCW1382116.1 hypothetical protein [Novosphingobium sp. KCTC 2891]